MVSRRVGDWNEGTVSIRAGRGLTQGESAWPTIIGGIKAGTTVGGVPIAFSTLSANPIFDIALGTLSANPIFDIALGTLCGSENLVITAPESIASSILPDE